MDISNNNNMKCNSENISFFLEEKEKEKESEENNENFLSQILQDLNNDEDDIMDFNPKLMYYMDKEFYGNDELYYNQEYTIKDLLKICQYYDIEKNIKSSKCKKQDMISTIVYFESLPENYELVKKRNLMWAYMNELSNNNKMKKYLIWN